MAAPSPSLLLLLLLLSTTISCGGQGEQPCTAAMRSSHAQHSRSGSEMSIANLAVRWHAMCFWMLMQSTRSTTPVPPPRCSLHSISLPSLPHTTTKKVSAPPCSRASTHAMAATGEGVVWGECGERQQQKRREEEAQHLTHSHRYHLLLVCAGVACRWRRTWAAGGGGEEREKWGCCCCCCVSSVHWHMQWVRIGTCVCVCVRRGRLSGRSSGVVVVVSQTRWR